MSKRDVQVGIARAHMAAVMYRVYNLSTIGWRKFTSVTPVAIFAIVGMAGDCAAQPQAKDVALDTANAVSLDPKAPNSHRNFAPELDKTVARMPKLDPKTGLHVAEVKPNLFFVTDGIYQSGFVRTGEGIIVFDAPSSFAHELPGVIEAHGLGEPVKFLTYSHSHADHIGGSTAFGRVAGLKIIAPEAVADAIGQENHPGILKPNTTFKDRHSLALGREVVEIKTGHFHSENTDAIIYLPRQKFIMAVDTITPGDVPYMDFGSTSNFRGYVEIFDELLRYDFDTILSGHVSILGTREDLILNRAYVHDVRGTALKGMATIMQPVFKKTFAAFGHKNGNLAYRVAMEAVRKDCTTQIIDRWKDKLSVVDVWADSHCETVISYAIMH
jgi:glyoxylase-like metal-dependent hydrolase (beta-lactamase superfamily II)